MIISLIALSILSGILYRCGGAGNEGRKAFPWLPKWVFDTKARDIGCALCVAGSYFIVGINAAWWLHLLAFLLLFGALTTYWDEMWGYDNFWFHGFMCGFACIPLVFSPDVTWWHVGLRSIVVAVGMGGISALSGDHIVEEVGRGAVLVASIFLFLL